MAAGSEASGNRMASPFATNKLCLITLAVAMFVLLSEPQSAAGEGLWDYGKFDGDSLYSGTPGLDKLVRGYCIVSQNGRYYLCCQHDRNIVLYDKFATYLQTGVAIWASNSANPYSTSWKELKMQKDGNLVLYSSDAKRAVWASNTKQSKQNQVGFRLRVENHGAAVLYNRFNTVLWYTR